MDLYACGLNDTGQLNLEPHCGRLGFKCAHPSKWNSTFCDLAPVELQKVLSASRITIIWSTFRGTLIQIDNSLYYWGEFEHRIPGLPYPDNPRRKHKDTVFKASGIVETSFGVSGIAGVVLNSQHYPEFLLLSTGDIGELKVIDDKIHLVKLPLSQESVPNQNVRAIAQMSDGGGLIAAIGQSTDNFVTEYASALSLIDGIALRSPRIFEAPVRQVVCSEAYVTVLTAANKVYTWRPYGEYISGLPPAGNMSNEEVAVRSVSVPSTPIIKIVSGPKLTGALTVAGELYIWGMLQRPTITDQPDEFVNYTSGSVVVKKAHIAGGALLADVGMGMGHVVALTRDGRLFSVGTGDDGQLGNGPAITEGDEYESVQPGDEFAADWVPMAMEVPAGKKIDAVFCGTSATFVYVAPV
ncbi:hypothetical protein MMC17_010120 [Xylographa soralifera]|nr:hypothetical protein [Xylographa soralifera]